MKRQRRAAGLCGAALIALAVAGCGSNGASGSEAGSSGGTLKIDFSNMETGNVAFPAITAAAKVAVEYLNKEKGGIAGRQVDLVTCDLKNDNDANQKCGQKVANDSGSPFGIVGMTEAGGSYYNAIKASGKPTLLGLEITPVDETAPNTYSYLTGTSGTFVDYAKYVKEHGYKSVAYIYHDDAAMKAANTTFMQALNDPSVKVQTTVIPTTASDILPQLSASGADKADVVIVQTAGKCSQVAQTFQSLGWKLNKVLTGGACLPTAQIKANPQLYGGWTLLGPVQSSAAGGDSSPDIKTFLDAWAKYSGSSEPPGDYAEIGWSAVMNSASAIQQAGVKDPTSKNIAAAFQSFTGPAVLGTADIKCPGPKDSPVSCATGLVSYSISDDGKLTLER